MHQSRTWLDLLREVIENSAERQRIAGILGVNPVTLTRWIEKRARPRAQNRQKLIDAMPAHMRQEFATLLAQEFPEEMRRSTEAEEDPIADIPSAFYARTFDAYTSTPPSLRSSSIITIILQQMLAHLDVEQEGLFISVIRCTRPAPGQAVRSLQEVIGRGTAPFKPYQGLQQSFLGAESLVGSAVMQCARRVNQNLRATSYAPALRTELEESAMACPFTFEDRVAGGLLVSSTRMNFFTPKHQRLVQEYTNLLVLAMRPEDFYEQSHIDLALMPLEREQQPYFQKFRRCVADIMHRPGNEALPESEAEIVAYQEIEREIVQQTNEQKVI
ncbi:MAG TPA: GAF domain-containing protein [Ktedonobacteraceae bacterium]|nr:GAF domain-containing protein [Ktedonobacteraceae bacterium]